MRILLFIFTIYNTIDNLSTKEINELIKIIENIAENDMDQKIMIGICDDTNNIELVTSYLNKFLNNDKISSAYIFLENTYYRFIGDGAHLYEKDISKEEKIVKYANALEENDNYINLYYVSGNDIDFYKLHDLNPNISCKVINESNENIINILKSPNYCMKYKREK